jgi:nitrite reductase/ring-hydroxylating ferredoxin subunit/thioredoxin reductase
MLKNGQMVQVSVGDAMDEDVFHPTDKIILAKHNDNYYALGSFCGFDFTNLSKGALLGERLYCPTCGSCYDITSGYVESGPTMRNLSNFPISVRGGAVEMTVPEHIPAFARKRFLKREAIDPRVFVVLGDNETALAVIDALRTGFTGRIIMIPCSNFGAFENTDTMKHTLAPLGKNQCYFVEDDYLDRANVDVIKGSIQMIDTFNRKMQVQGYQQPIKFDKICVAWGANRKRLLKSYSNVHYIEDRYSHAKLHNDLLRAKHVVVVGKTLEALQVAQSTRNYLDDIGQYHTKVMVMNDGNSEVTKTLGTGMEKWLAAALSRQRISYQPNVNIVDMVGDNDVEKIIFNKAEDIKDGKIAKIDYFVEPDLVIIENGIDRPKKELVQMVGYQDQGMETKVALSLDFIP